MQISESVGQMPKKSGIMPTYRACVALQFLTLISLNGTAVADTRWVWGSWVNVRATSSPNSTVIDHINTNTQVDVLEQADKACAISWAENKKGNVPCALLGDHALKLSEVSQEFEPHSNRSNMQYSPLRAFWISPSTHALFDAGDYFRERMLSKEQKNLEEGIDKNGQLINSDKAPKLIRYPIPEFEAMKAVLAKGVVAGANLDWQLLDCHQLHQQALNGGGFLDPSPECQYRSFPQFKLPPIHTSLFKNAGEVLPSNAGIEATSAHFGIKEIGQVIGRPKWIVTKDESNYSGAWDIGAYTLRLERPVVEHVIGRTGLVGAYQWSGDGTHVPHGYEDCADGLARIRLGKTLLPGYPAIKDALLWFETPAALPIRTANIKKRILPEPKKAGAVRDVVYEIDLDGDGIADFVQWDEWGVTGSSDPNSEVWSRLTFVNIAGIWYFFDQDGFQECS